jgi:hypothetical protein
MAAAFPKIIRSSRAMTRTAISDPTRDFKDTIIDPAELAEEEAKQVSYIYSSRKMSSLIIIIPEKFFIEIMSFPHVDMA